LILVRKMRREEALSNERLLKRFGNHRTRNPLPLGGRDEKSDSSPSKPSYRRKKTRA
jgi:hypothetical protein